MRLRIRHFCDRHRIKRSAAPEALALVEARPKLPEHVRAAIRTLVTSAGTE